MFKTNEYFDGKVVSLSHNGAAGNSSVGVIAAGEYSFDTSSVEIMTVISGEMKALLPGENEWKTYKKFESFRIEKNSSFKVRVTEDTPYHCQYL